MTIKSYCFIWIFYYCIIWVPQFDNKKASILISLMYIVFFLQFVIQICQIGWAFIFSDVSSDDIATGTFSGANNLSYAYFFPLFFACYLFLFEKKHTYLFKVLYSFLGMVMSWGMFAILTFPFVFGLFTFNNIIKNIRMLLPISALFILFATGFYGIQRTNTRQQSGIGKKYGAIAIFSPEYLITKFTKDEFSIYHGSARLLWFPITYERLKKYAVHPMIGMGPGMYASYTAFRFMPPSQQSVFNIFNQIEKGLDPGIDSQIIPIWGEFGYIGICITVIFFLFMSYKYYRIYCQSVTPIQRGTALTASAGSIYLLLGMYANHILENQNIMLFYVLFCGISYRLYKNNM